MNTVDELIGNGIEKQVAFMMISNYESRIGSVYGCQKLIDINYDFDKKCQMWTFRCELCGSIKTVKKPKLRDVSTTCACQKIKKEKNKKKTIKNNDESFLGKIYGNDKVIGFKKDSKGCWKWQCECQLCGRIHLRNPSDLKHGKYQKCFCKSSVKNYDEYIGMKNNFLIIVGVVREKGMLKLICECDCGNIKKIRPYDWMHETVKSCGCKRDKLLSTHGLSNTRIYRIWRGMTSRCYDENNSHYDYYGGRGIQICDEWKGEEGLINFYEWSLSHGYSDELSIDRIDTNGNYTQDNCRWADDYTQAKNKRKRGTQKPIKIKPRVFVEIDGVEIPLKKLCEEYGVSDAFVRYRMKKLGMSAKEAVETPKKTLGRPKKGNEK